MDCPKWEEFGLLYAARELGEQERAVYEEHLAGCDTCRAELEWYAGGRERFFTPDILCEAPSEKVDREILRVCSDPRKKITGLRLMPAFRKALLPTALFAMAFITVGYFTMNIQNARQIARLAAKQVTQTAAVKVQTPPQTVATTVAVTSNDSVFDSAHKTDANFAGHRGNLQETGVIPVDLKK